MDIDTFWRLIDSTRGMPDRAANLGEKLQSYTPDELVQFRLRYDDEILRANRVDLWAAANAINGHCDDGQFHDFREGLIELGREVFDRAVADPDSLADVAVPGVAIAGEAGLGFEAGNVWAAATGKTEDEFFAAVDAADTATDRGDAEEGEWWDFDNQDELFHRLPKIAAKFTSASEE